jgi:hypothetical protein
MGRLYQVFRRKTQEDRVHPLGLFKEMRAAGTERKMVKKELEKQNTGIAERTGRGLYLHMAKEQANA